MKERTGIICGLLFLALGALLAGPLWAEDERSGGGSLDQTVIPPKSSSPPPAKTATGSPAGTTAKPAAPTTGKTPTTGAAPAQQATKGSPETLRIDRKIAEYLHAGNVEKAILALNYGEKVLNREKNKDIRVFLWNRLQQRKKELATLLTKLLEQENSRLGKRITTAAKNPKDQKIYDQLTVSTEFVRRRVKTLREYAKSLSPKDRERAKKAMDKSVSLIKAAEKLSPPFGGSVADYPSWASITSPFGNRVHPILGYTRFHDGVDIPFDYNHPLKALGDGVVTHSGSLGGYGNVVEIAYDHPKMGKITVLYAHLNSCDVPLGSRVKKGQIVGKVGSTGLSSGPHLHMSVYRNGAAIDPTSVPGIKFP